MFQMQQLGNVRIKYIFLCLLISVSVSMAANRVIETYIGNGDYSKAYNLLLEEISKHPDDAETIYLLGLCSQSGNRSSLYLKDYMQKFPNGKHAGEVLGLLIDYYSSSGLLITAGSIFENTDEEKFSSPLNLYKAALYKQQLGEYHSAIDIFNKAANSGDDEIKGWAELGLADCRLSQDNYNTALASYKRLVEEYRDSDIFPLDKSKVFYDLYRERFEESPRNIEIEAALIDKKTPGNNHKLQTLIDVDYYVQVGVFARQSNAETCLKKFRNLRYAARMTDFRDGGKSFHRVVIGPFGSESQAREVKTELERTQGEKYTLFIQ
jgi:tetratricopeptide (TPR) repeat protein